MEDFQSRLEAYRRKKAVFISFAIMIYILSIALLVALSFFFPKNGDEVGVIIMLIMIAVATGMIVYISMTVPLEFVDVLKKNEDNFETPPTGAEASTTSSKKSNYKSDIFQSVLKLYWLVVTIVYIGCSFLTMAWHITWLIWLIGVAVEQVIKIIYSMHSK